MKKVSFRPAPLPRLDRIATRCPAPPAHAPLHSASPSRLAPAPALRSALFVTSPHRPIVLAGDTDAAGASAAGTTRALRHPLPPSLNNAPTLRSRQPSPRHYGHPYGGRVPEPGTDCSESSGTGGRRLVGADGLEADKAKKAKKANHPADEGTGEPPKKKRKKQREK